MVNQVSTVEEVESVFGMLLAFTLFLAPIPTIRTIHKEKDTKEFSSDPYVSGILNCGVWVIYALPSVTPNRTTPLVTNFIGFLMEMAYCLAFYKYCNARNTRRFKRSFGPSVLFLLFMLLFPFVFCAKPSDASDGIGVVAAILNIGMYASPLTIMKQVWDSKSVQYMPLHLSVATFFCSFAWMCYGITVNDKPIMICNITGTLLGAAQIALYLTVFFHPERAEEDGGNKYTSILEDDVEVASDPLSSSNEVIMSDDVAVL
jgi:solute carrier family 50 (sugar transporter)